MNLDKFPQTVEQIRIAAAVGGRLIDNPSDRELKVLVAEQPGVKKTRYGSFVAESGPSSRAAMFTKNSEDDLFGETEEALLSQATGALAQERLISLDRVVGDGRSCGPPRV